MEIEPLTADAFLPFGDVIDTNRPGATPINQGYADRFGDLARLDTSHGGGRPSLSIYRVRPCTMPFRLRLLERHKFGSQAFIPLSSLAFLVIVGPGVVRPQIDQLRVFRTAPGQGVNIARGVWHHPLVSLVAGEFLVIERTAPDLALDCKEWPLSAAEVWVHLPCG